MNNKYKSITIDECVKYGNVSLGDRIFDFIHLNLPKLKIQNLNGDKHVFY